MIVDTDPNYRDTTDRLANARHQQQLASLLAEAHRLHRAGQWAAVLKIGEQLQAIDPAAADPDGLMKSARAELAAEQQAAQLAAAYHTGLRLFDAGRWQEAVEALERVTRVDSAYRDAPTLLHRARQEMGQAAALAEEQPRREAAEHVRREDKVDEPMRREAKAEEQARREAGDQARQEPEEQSRLNQGIIRVNRIIRTIIAILVLLIITIVILQLT
jgi:hypothetical protein